MKKLVLAAAVAAMTPGAFAEAAAPAVPAEASKNVEAVNPGKGVRQRHQFDRAKFEERMKQRRADRLVKVVEAVKAAGITDEAKAKELAETIDKLYARPMRPPRPPRNVRPGERPAAKD